MPDPTTEPKPSRISLFTRYQAEADFWDTHNFTEFADETKLVKVEPSSKLASIYSIRVDEETSQKLDTVAKKKGIGPTTLGRMLIMEGLDRLEAGRVL